MTSRIFCLCAAGVLVWGPAAAQESSADQHFADQSQPESKHLFWIVPNYRTSPSLVGFKPLSAAEKFSVAAEDAFDPGTFALAGIFAGEAQVTNQNKSFGQGVAGSGRYYAASYAGFAIGDYMTEAVFPTLLHQDPRYFRKGTGSGWSRLGYAMGQIFITHGDSGRTEVNYSEIVGNSVAVAISDAYYKDSRTARDGVSGLGLQLGVDMGGNVLKEFWPELERMFQRKSRPKRPLAELRVPRATRASSAIPR
jgi:hypothetical protein